ncbi:MAG TPA: hypothetical protein VKZ56_02220 [Membranihabitans sp.]|nr:hypothetical protein [Membranihabitans sp.]
MSCRRNETEPKTGLSEAFGDEGTAIKKPSEVITLYKWKVGMEATPIAQPGLTILSLIFFLSIIDKNYSR